MTGAVLAERETWRRALRELRPVPAPHVVRDMPLDTAAQQLACPPEVLTDLVADGFPADRTAGGTLLDVHDVANLGLLAGTGRSFSEQAESRLMRMSRGNPESWSEERGWRLRVVASCPAGCVVEPGAPDPESTGGAVVGITRPAPNEAVVELFTRGLVDAPRTPQVRTVFDDLLADLRSDRLRFGWLPHMLRARPADAVAHGVVDCVVAAWLMAAHAATTGLEARTRKGYVLGPVPVEHAWTEVREDGRWLPLDPVLAFLAGRHPGADEHFAGYCCGSGHNRLLAWPIAADEPFDDHSCPGGHTAGHTCTVLATRATPATG